MTYNRGIALLPEFHRVHADNPVVTVGGQTPVIPIIGGYVEKIVRAEASPSD
ncbi:hypothetical protein ACFLV1_01550 [Chloroflexota bacterium]